MENIIVGIDFSECAHNAMEHALSTANTLDANLTLLFILASNAKLLNEESKKIAKGSILDVAQNKLQKLVDECKSKYPNVNVKYKIRIASEKISKEINEEAKEQGNALIFVGAHGLSGFDEFFLGSHSFKVVSYSDFPVFTIREANVITRRLERIMLLIDSNRETLQKVKLSAQLAKAFNAKVYVLGLQASAHASNRAIVKSFVTRAENYMSERGIRTETGFLNIKAKQPETLLKYAEEHEINLLVCMKEIELYANEVFVLTSFNERLVNISHIPVLTIPIDHSIYDNTIQN